MKRAKATLTVTIEVGEKYLERAVGLVMDAIPTEDHIAGLTIGVKREKGKTPPSKKAPAKKGKS